MTTYGPFIIKTRSPTSNSNVECSETGRRDNYMYLPSPTGNRYEVSVTENPTQFFVKITVDPTTNTNIANIYSLSNGEFIYMAYEGNEGIANIQPTDNKSGNASIGWILYDTITASTELSSVSNGTLAFIKTTITDNEWLLNYSKTVLGRFDGLDNLTVDTLNGTPLTTDNGRVSCNYVFTFLTPITTTNAVVFSTNELINRSNMKVKRITTSDNDVFLELFRSSCVSDGETISCKRLSEILLFLSGIKSGVEQFFDVSYNVKANINHDIVNRECGDNESKLSFYRLDENYEIMHYCNHFTLLTNEINPNCEKINRMIRKFNKFISNIKCNKSHHKHCRC